MLVLVTGSSKGIGYEAVLNFAKDPACKVIAVSRGIDKLESLARQNANVKVVRADINTAEGRKAIVEAIQSSGEKLDVLVNNAGEMLNKDFETITEEELTSVYHTNVFAPFFLIQTLVQHMNAGKKAHIVNISSMGGFQGSAKFSGLSAYSSSKAALSGLTECLAEELKSKNIAVNCLALGAVQTEMLDMAFPGYQAPLSAKQMAGYICDFALNGHKYYNGKILPVSSTTP
jgi:3-oxoacyl-[acyl-carrier protein] reductase